MRTQSPQSRFVSSSVRVVHSPQNSFREDRVTKVTYRPKTTVTTTTYRPVETRTVRLCAGDTKCQGHELHIESLTNENTKLNQRLIEVEQESASWSERYQNMESSYSEEVDYLQKEIEQYRSQIKVFEEQSRFLKQTNEQQENTIDTLTNRLRDLNNQISEDTSIWEHKVSENQNQLRLMRDLGEERWREILTLRAELERRDSISFSVEQKEMQIISYTKQNAFLEMRIRELEDNSLGHSKETENLMLRIHTLQTQLEYFQTECQELSESRDSLHREQQKLISDNSRYQETINSYISSRKESQIEIDQLNTQITSLVNDISKLRNTIDALQRDAELSRKEYECNQSSISQQLLVKVTELEMLKIQIEGSEEHIHENEFAKQQLMNEYQALYRKYNEETLQQKVINEELEIQLKTLSAIRTQVQKQLDDKIIELSNTRGQLQQSLQEQHQNKTQSAEEIYSLKMQLQDTILSLNKVTQRTGTLNEELERKDNQLNSLQETLATTTKDLTTIRSRVMEEGSSFKSQMDQYELQIITLSKQKSQLETQIEELTLELHVISDDKHNLKVSLEAQIAELKKKIYIYEEKLSLLSSEIQRMIFQAQEKEAELRKAQFAQEELASKLKNIEQLWRSDSINYQEKIAELEERLTQNDLRDELDQVNIELRYKSSILEELNSKNAFLQSQLQSNAQTIQDLKHYVEQQSQILKESEHELQLHLDTESELKFKLDKLIEEIKTKQYHIEELENHLDSQVTNIEQTEETVSYYKKEVDSWKDKFSAMNREYHRNLEQLMMTQAEFDAYKQRELKVFSSTVEVRKSSLYKENLTDISKVSTTRSILKEVN